MAPSQEFGPSQSDFARLDERVGAVETSNRIIAAGNALLHEQVSELTVMMHRQDTQVRAELAENSKVTRETLAAANEIRDLVTTAKTGGKFVKWLAPTLVAGTVAVGVVKGWMVDVGAVLSSLGGRK